MEWVLPLSLILLCSAGLQVFLTWMVMCRIRTDSRAARRLHLALAIHLVGEPLRRDAAFVGLLDRYRKTPRELDKEDRVRARSWNRTAVRIYALALEDPETASAALWSVPAMGENRVETDSPDLPSIEELIDLDPEFLSFVDALRDS